MLLVNEKLKYRHIRYFLAIISEKEKTRPKESERVFYTHQISEEASGASDGARTRDLRRDRPTL